MPHLTDEQIEQLVADPGCEHEHLDGCGLCRDRLNEAAAIRRRLRKAWDSVQADTVLKNRVVASIRSAAGGDTAAGRAWSTLRRIGPGLLAAAAVLVIALGLATYLGAPRRATAAPAELAQIHQSNVMPHTDLHGADDPQAVADFLRQETGFIPAMPKLGAGMALRGCCVAHFRNRPVGSYVVETDRGVISIIVLDREPGELEFARTIRRRGRTYHLGAFARCTMAAIEIGKYTYAAVGETDAVWLTDVLDNLAAQYSSET